MKTPQVLITLAPSGELQAELPGPNGARRLVPIHNLESVRRILSSQLSQPIQIGLDSAPTTGQVRHWEEHTKTPSPYCPWCIAEELGIDTSNRAFKRAKKLTSSTSSAKITYLKPKTRKIKSRPIQTISPEDFGL